MDLHNKNTVPTLEEIAEYIKNPVFLLFCNDIKTAYNCKERIEFSSCSWEYGWNIKFKKSGRALCTVYPREHYFTVLVVLGKKEKDAAEAVLQECNPILRDIYSQTRESNSQRWLMIDLEDKDGLYADTLRLIALRRG